MWGLFLSWGGPPSSPTHAPRNHAFLLNSWDLLMYMFCAFFNTVICRPILLQTLPCSLVERLKRTTIKQACLRISGRHRSLLYSSLLDELLQEDAYLLVLTWSWSVQVKCKLSSKGRFCSALRMALPEKSKSDRCWKPRSQKLLFIAILIMNRKGDKTLSGSFKPSSHSFPGE